MNGVITYKDILAARECMERNDVLGFEDGTTVIHNRLLLQACNHDEWQDKRIKELQAQVDERDALIRDGITHLCSYCMDNKERSWEEMQQHIHVCDKHPLKAAEAKIDKIAEFFPVCGEVQCTEQYQKIQAAIKGEEQKP